MRLRRRTSSISLDSDLEMTTTEAVEVQPKLDARWEVVGPFPAGMREHTIFGSPLHAFPPSSGEDVDIDFARRPFNTSDTWPSELAVGGHVEWSTFEMEEDGKLDIAFHGINWKQYRSDHGWASLQHQVLARGRFHLPGRPDEGDVAFKVDLLQGVEYAFVPVEGRVDLPVKWYQGDIYSFGTTPSGLKDAGQTSNYSRSLAFPPGEYIMLIRAIYEIRLFGDPGLDKVPTINLTIRTERQAQKVELLTGLEIVPSVVEGRMMGHWISIGVRVPATGENVDVTGLSEDQGCSLATVSPTRIASGQTRMVALKVKTTGALLPGTTSISVTLQVRSIQTGGTERLIWQIPIEHKSLADVLKITFAAPEEPIHGPPHSVAYTMIVPPSPAPSDLRNTADIPVNLALHGAGVTPEWEMWTSAPPKNGAWSVLPMGRTEWGEDWHGGSMAEAWRAREVFGEMAAEVGVKVSEKTLLIGHSNGGQGAWHLAARYPDRIIGVIAAAGYTKIQDYVPYTESFSNHYADPALMGILNSSLTPYNNDLHHSNLVYTPKLALHGSADGNVPPRHSRLQASIIAAWSGDKDAVKVVDVPGKDHWWDGMLNEKPILNFIQKLRHTTPLSWAEMRKKGFTLTCANPAESGSMAGIRIADVLIPGRLARLDVNTQSIPGQRDACLVLLSTNVKRIEITPVAGCSGKVFIDGVPVNVVPETGSVHNYISSDRPGRGFGWDLVDLSEHSPVCDSQLGLQGPVLRILASRGPIVIAHGNDDRSLSLAKRIAHDLFVYHRIDAEIITSDEASKNEYHPVSGQGNIIVLGKKWKDPDESESTRPSSASPNTSSDEGLITFAGRLIEEHGTGLIALRPIVHGHFRGLQLHVVGNDDVGLELAARLVPIRTGVCIPDWAIVSPRCQWQGAGGLIGAGFWNADWTFSEVMSWLDRSATRVRADGSYR
ncbi:hypothetical protein BD324DRAFT_626687 [Kockovaella imperatae]|uniref:Peptidase S9 prolyl oligopeptidase catalytic domain-containing protein n=1 Tax=Kockovaella imperatae TaxID=4999 RepID=A0A1Y1UGM1_9TREE|nr:hypothetical protein BD324DRAFT_626687 [Kockovaella imperatae]ORX36656.1 hypothetical protein BD324DRAFT_626687 [Kockovaella imperatae]